MGFSLFGLFVDASEHLIPGNAIERAEKTKTCLRTRRRIEYRKQPTPVAGEVFQRAAQIGEKHKQKKTGSCKSERAFLFFLLRILFLLFFLPFFFPFFAAAMGVPRAADTGFKVNAGPNYRAGPKCPQQQTRLHDPAPPKAVASHTTPFTNACSAAGPNLADRSLTPRSVRNTPSSAVS